MTCRHASYSTIMNVFDAMLIAAHIASRFPFLVDMPGLESFLLVHVKRNAIPRYVKRAVCPFNVHHSGAALYSPVTTYQSQERLTRNTSWRHQGASGR